MMKFTLASCVAAPINQLGRWWRHALGLALSLLVATAMGCGGGGTTSVAGVGSGGTGSFASGPITGFGSIIVNGIHFDESAASGAGAIKDEDGVVGSSSSLKLGMVVNVTGSSIYNGAATATAVTFVSELVGPIATGSINPASKTFVVLGQTIAVTGSTFFDDGLVNGFADLKANDVVEIYGFNDSVNYLFSATRIEKKDPKAQVKLIGEVSSLNTASKTFAIGAVTVTYANAQPIALTNTQVVRVKGKLTAAGLDASRIQLQGAGTQNIGARDEVEIEGVVDPYTSATSFSVNGIKVDARNATVLGGAVAQGMRVEVAGSISSDSVLVARKVTIESKSDVDMSEFRVKDVVSNLSVGAKTFQVRGVTVDYSAVATKDFENGVEADLAKLPAPTVDVWGQRSAIGTSIKATRIKFK